MKKVIFILLSTILVSCLNDDDSPITDKVNNVYNLDSLKSDYTVNGRDYSTIHYDIINGYDFTFYRIGIDTNEYISISIPDSASTISDITQDSIYTICINTPTIDGGNLYTCDNDVTKSFEYELINDSTIFIEFEASITLSDYTKDFVLPSDSILNTSGNITLYNSLK